MPATTQPRQAAGIFRAAAGGALASSLSRFPELGEIPAPEENGLTFCPKTPRSRPVLLLPVLPLANGCWRTTRASKWTRSTARPGRAPRLRFAADSGPDRLARRQRQYRRVEPIWFFCSGLAGCSRGGGARRVTVVYWWQPGTGWPCTPPRARSRD